MMFSTGEGLELGQLQLLLCQIGPQGFPSPSGGSAHPGVQSHALDCDCSSSLGVPDAAAGVLLGPKPAPPLSLECAGNR